MDLSTLENWLWRVACSFRHAYSVADYEDIASIMSNVDEVITIEEDRKAALQDLFKSALHQLMTGRIRLLSDEELPL